MDNRDDDQPNMRRDAMTEVLGHVVAIRIILAPLIMLEEERDRKQRERVRKKAGIPHEEIPA